jgi:hypothetical protein
MYQGGIKVRQADKQIKFVIFCDNEEQRADLQDLLDTLKRRMHERRTCNALHKTLQAIIYKDR